MKSSRPPSRIRDVRDGVVLVDFPEASDEEANRLCVALSEALRAAAIAGLLDAAPAARSLQAVFDPGRCSRARLRAAVEAASPGEPGPEVPRRRLIVPVAYGGPDLDELARAANLPPEEFARRHAGTEYRVAFLGFAPGFAYLSGLAPELAASRLNRPRTRVPAGAVAIGGGYTGIYPLATPGGWRLIGQTAVRLFDPESDSPSLLNAGDRVRFEPVRAGDLAAPPPARAAEGTPDTTERAAVLRVSAGGLATTVQGSPAHGLASSGVPPGGAMDPEALARANLLAGNPPDLPGLEIALAGPELTALAECVVALGGELEAEWNGRPAPTAAPFRLAAGDRLRLGRVRRGCWAYLALRGGVAPPSRRAPQPRLAANQTLFLQREPGLDEHSALAPPPPPAGPELRLRVFPGPEADRFAPSERERFFGSPWTVTPESDRRGLRLGGAEPLAHLAAPDIPPSGTVPGTIQVPGSGLPIVLGPDGPVTGGYHRVATVIGADLALLGRAGAGNVLRFVPVTLEQALNARRAPVVVSGSTMSLP